MTDAAKAIAALLLVLAVFAPADELTLVPPQADPVSPDRPTTPDSTPVDQDDHELIPPQVIDDPDVLPVFIDFENYRIPTSQRNTWITLYYWPDLGKWQDAAGWDANTTPPTNARPVTMWWTGKAWLDEPPQQARYPVRGSNWSVDGNYNPSHATVCQHLRAHHQGQFPAEWQIETWTLAEVRSLHSDIHERRQQTVCIGST